MQYGPLLLSGCLIGNMTQSYLIITKSINLIYNLANYLNHHVMTLKRLIEILSDLIKGYIIQIMGNNSYQHAHCPNTNGAPSEEINSRLLIDQGHGYKNRLNLDTLNQTFSFSPLLGFSGNYQTHALSNLYLVYNRSIYISYT